MEEKSSFLLDPEEENKSDSQVSSLSDNHAKIEVEKCGSASCRNTSEDEISNPTTPRRKGSIADLKFHNFGLDIDNSNYLKPGRSNYLQKKRKSVNYGRGKGLIIPEHLPLIESGHSLKPDLKSGWKPTFENMRREASIPLKFNYEEVVLPRPKGGSDYPIVIYRGARPANSLELNEYMAIRTGTKSQDIVEASLREYYKEFVSWLDASSRKEQPEFIGMTPFHDEREMLHFDSSFESGNADIVVLKSKFEYDIYPRSDANTKGHCYWYYFSVKTPWHPDKVKKYKDYSSYKEDEELKKTMKVKFNIHRALDTNGMKICYKINDAKWQRGGENFSTSQKTISLSHKGKIIEKKISVLTFDFAFTNSMKTVSFAPCFPYTYTQLSDFLKECDYYCYTNNRTYFERSSLCRSIGGNCVHLIKIHDPKDTPYKNENSNSNVKDDNNIFREKLEKEKKIVIITARIHPGESMSSWVMEGLIKFLVFANSRPRHQDSCSSNGSVKQSKIYTSSEIKIARYLRKKFKFIIIPMVNPDGVIAGNYLTSFAGHDLNKVFLVPNKDLHPSIYALKDLIASNKENIFTYIDIQGHSKKKCTFLYGPEFPLHNQNYFKVRALPKILDSTEEHFRFHSCSFHVNKHNKTTSRVILWSKFDIILCYVFGVSFSGYMSKDHKIYPFTRDKYLQTGESLCKGLFILVKSLIQQEVIQHHFKYKFTGTKKLRYNISSFTNRKKSTKQSKSSRPSAKASVKTAGKPLVKSPGRLSVKQKGKQNKFLRKTIFQNVQKAPGTIKNKSKEGKCEKKNPSNQKSSNNRISTNYQQSVVEDSIASNGLQRNFSVNLVKEKQLPIDEESKRVERRTSGLDKINLKKLTTSSLQASGNKESGENSSTWNVMMKEFKKTISEGQSSLSCLDNKKFDTSGTDMQNLNLSESASFTSGISTDEEEECLNNILNALNQANPSINRPKRFDLRGWRKMCLEEEKKLKLERLSTLIPEPEINLSPAPKKIAKKPKMSSKNIHKYQKIELFKDLKNKKFKNFRREKKEAMASPQQNLEFKDIVTKQSSVYSLSGFDKKSVTPATVAEYSEYSTKSEKGSAESSFEFKIIGKNPSGAQIMTARSPYLKRIYCKNEEPLLPTLRPVTPGIVNPLRTRKAMVKGKFIDLVKPTKKMIEMYGLTSLIHNPKIKTFYPDVTKFRCFSPPVGHRRHKVLSAKYVSAKYANVKGKVISH
ncbi:unnamed protein product [Moneuplotes crassus]|uniref:Peptidase M14 domain-containing protein n=1 Tax=Euplotes crassus TaxID=5936 RepID=A0AAD1U913_EUPCR|nr:unnamed protein product [Moneuplotes crassus]